MVITVGARDLKNRLGSYLRLVRDGARVIVTERGRPVAELRPLNLDDASVEARLERLAVEGIVTPPSRHDGPDGRSMPIAAVDVGLSDAVIEDRRDRL